jgi:hypothetical protein
LPKLRAFVEHVKSRATTKTSRGRVIKAAR